MKKKTINKKVTQDVSNGVFKGLLKFSIFGYIAGFLLFGLIVFLFFTFFFSQIVIDNFQCKKFCSNSTVTKQCVDDCSYFSVKNPHIVTQFIPESLLSGLNEQRKDKGQSPVYSDPTLCMYAQKLASDSKQLQKPADEIYKADLLDTSVRSRYFSKFTYSSQKQIVTPNFSTQPLPKELRGSGVLFNKDVEYGCFAVIPAEDPNNSIIQFVGATR